MTGLVYIGKITSVDSIPGADFITAVTVICGEGGKWRGVIPLAQYDPASLYAVFLPDALLPDIPDFSFMATYKFRVKQRKFKGVPSEVLIMPVKNVLKDTPDLTVGMDVTQQLCVTKYEFNNGAIGGAALGQFPGFIPKTDEIHWQKMGEIISAIKNEPCVATLKIDGTSCTVYNYKDGFNVCSRNFRLKNDGNVYWRMAEKYLLQDKLPYGYAIQFEIAGPKIQGNRLQLTSDTAYIFNIFDIDRQMYLGYREMLDFRAGRLDHMPMAPLVSCNVFMDENTDFASLADRTYSCGAAAEGVVIRTMQERQVNGVRCSFKVINLNYKG